ncbi:hypothetical protein OVY01_11940 [Robbsia sp. Bb-Pol-6]|uniref:Glycosyl transferase family 28 C-terminal domain-containing protein n=1 Tax=Robbsia betulipollinis TaxID=2981849 RepID=A0ABT3ZN33_9BURK|nr:hypothetical protein [Robbsia betulipollinis]MCY0387934.1 hypothetical protein [Robbsia betulipollinis]
MRKVSIGYYAHHHGSGHVSRALQIGRFLDHPPTLFSSAPLPDHDASHVTFCRLDPDTGNALANPTPHGLHYAPTGLRGIVERTGRMVDWFRAQWPCVLVVDVSVEVALLARLCAVPTILIRQNGIRTDAPHRLAYDSAVALLAPFPAALGAKPEDDAWGGKTVFTGFISRYSTPARTLPAAPNTVSVLIGHGGTMVTLADLCAAARATPAWRWSVLGPIAPDSAVSCPANLDLLGIVPDPAEHLRRAQIVVGSAGDNVVAEMAYLRCRYIALSEPRPFDEQILTAQTLERLGLALHCPDWPVAPAWPALLQRASALDASGWNAFTAQSGAETAARAIQAISDQAWKHGIENRQS